MADAVNTPPLLRRRLPLAVLTRQEPKRTRMQRTSAWLRRGKLWDDVFTRTVGGVLTLLIIGFLAAVLGLVHLSREDWTTTVVMLILTIYAVLVFVRFLRISNMRDEQFPSGHAPQPWKLLLQTMLLFLVGALIVAGIGVAIIRLF